MKKFYGTFGSGHENAGKVQPIIAVDEQHAEQKMFDIYGKEWAFIYSEEQFEQFKREGYYKNVTVLETVYAHIDMTAGEMLGWTKQFNQILTVPKRLRDRHLARLMTDLERVYNIPMIKDEEFNKLNPFVIQLYRAVSEARSI